MPTTRDDYPVALLMLAEASAKLGSAEEYQQSHGAYGPGDSHTSGAEDGDYDSYRAELAPVQAATSQLPSGYGGYGGYPTHQAVQEVHRVTATRSPGSGAAWSVSQIHNRTVWQNGQNGQQGISDSGEVRRVEQTASVSKADLDQGGRAIKAQPLPGSVYQGNGAYRAALAVGGDLKRSVFRAYVPASVEHAAYVPASVEQAAYVPASVEQTAYVAPASVEQGAYTAPASVEQSAYVPAGIEPGELASGPGVYQGSDVYAAQLPVVVGQQGEGQEADWLAQEDLAQGTDAHLHERFQCPYPGCGRSFAELWRLKAHYRAPPDMRGSGKERGHGADLPTANPPQLVPRETPDTDRFYCPYPGCTRSFVELWRLKVHHRAPPNIRGSGKERGHGSELTMCPKCAKELKPGRHHTDCAADTQRHTKRATKRKTPEASEQQ